MMGLGVRQVARAKVSREPLAGYDKWLLFAMIALLLLGLLMVASSSVMISTKYFHQPFHFLIRQVCYLLLGFFVGMLVMRVETRLWQQWSVPLLLGCLVMLVMVDGRDGWGSYISLKEFPDAVPPSKLQTIDSVLDRRRYFLDKFIC